MRRTAVKRQLSHLHRSLLPAVVFLQANYLVSFPTSDPLGMHRHLLTKMDLKVKASGRSTPPYGLALSLDT